jgi:hypothetical protein
MVQGTLAVSLNRALKVVSDLANSGSNSSLVASHQLEEAIKKQLTGVTSDSSLTLVAVPAQLYRGKAMR